MDSSACSFLPSFPAKVAHVRHRFYPGLLQAPRGQFHVPHAELGHFNIWANARNYKAQLATLNPPLPTCTGLRSPRETPKVTPLQLLSFFKVLRSARSPQTLILRGDVAGTEAAVSKIPTLLLKAAPSLLTSTLRARWVGRWKTARGSASAVGTSFPAAERTSYLMIGYRSIWCPFICLQTHCISKDDLLVVFPSSWNHFRLVAATYVPLGKTSTQKGQVLMPLGVCQGSHQDPSTSPERHTSACEASREQSAFLTCFWSSTGP